MVHRLERKFLKSMGQLQGVMLLRFLTVQVPGAPRGWYPLLLSAPACAHATSFTLLGP